MGMFFKLKHISGVDKIYSSNHFNYAFKREDQKYYAWGCGDYYVLANGKEDTLTQARPINNEKVFKNFPNQISLGSNHITYFSGEKADSAHLNELIQKST